MTIMGGAFILIVCMLALNLSGTTSVPVTSEVVPLFQEYIRINTTTHNDLTPAVEFWKRLATQENVLFRVVTLTEGYPIIIMKWPGTNSTASSIMLNSHMDVVPANEKDGWTYAPFEAVLAEDNNIYGRGTQDMKSVSMQYFEALKRLKADGVTFVRDVYMTLMPDEEVGAKNGMMPFLRTAEFASMNVGFSMDEGTPYPIPMVALFYQDKVVWQIQVDCHGTAAHGSTFTPTNTTATGKCRNVIDRIFDYREEQYMLATKATILNAGTYTSVNLNKMNAGTANNIIPQLVSLVFDIRLSTTLNEVQFEAELREWIAAAGPGIDLTFISKNRQSPATLVNTDNPYFLAIKNGTEEAGLEILPIVPPGSTDARHVRSAGIPAFGFSPMPNTDMLLHAVNEHINVDIFLQGIVVYEHIINNLANIPAEDTSRDPSVYLFQTFK